MPDDPRPGPDRLVDVVSTEDGWAAESHGEVIMTARTEDDLVGQLASTARGTGQATTVRVRGPSGDVLRTHRF